MIKVLHLTVPQRPFSNAKIRQIYDEIVFNFSEGEEQLKLIWGIYSDHAQFKELGIQYKEVAEVNTDDFDKAYELTNNIEMNWVDNEGVRYLGKNKGERSTSIGDILLHQDKVVTVATFGFVTIGP
jgi:hypothetical protein